MVNLPTPSPLAAFVSPSNRQLLSLLGHAVCLFNCEGRIDALNAVALEQLGWQEQEVVGEALHELLYGALIEADPFADPPLSGVISTDLCPHYAIVDPQHAAYGDRFASTDVFWQRDGNIISVECLAAAVVVDGVVVGGVLSWYDFTEVNSRELRLTESEQRMRLIIENSLDAIISVDSDELIIDWNSRAETLFGWTKEEVAARGLTHTIISPNYRDAHRHGFDRFVRSGVIQHTNRYFEVIGLHKDGHEIDIEISITPFITTQGNYIITATCRDITARKLARRTIIEAAQAAEAANRAKSDFLANMSHEIRTPMNAILGMTYLLQQTELNGRQQNYVGKVHQAAEHLLGIINNILDFSKMEAGKMTLEQIPFTLKEVVQRLLDRINPTAQERKIQLDLRLDAHLPPQLIGDPLQLGQVLFNLAHNAVKFTDSGGKVVIAITVDPKRVEKGVLLNFVVRDTGIGMSTEQQRTLFTSFNQVDSSTTRKYGGTGLGLAITHELVTLMGGEIAVKSEFGRGTEFGVRITFEVPTGSVSAPPPSSTSTLPTIPPHLIGQRLLLVEDNRLNQEIALELLRRFGFVVDLAENGQQALEAIQNHAYSAVLMDCQMPVMDGYEATRAIRRLEGGQQLPIIALTANAMAGDRERVLAVGMNDFIAKPFVVAELLTKLITWLSQQHPPAPAPLVEPLLEREALVTQLRHLQELIKEFDTDAQWVSHDLLTLFTGTQTQTDIENLYQTIRCFDFEQAEVQLARLLERLDIDL